MYFLRECKQHEPRLVHSSLNTQTRTCTHLSGWSTRWRTMFLLCPIYHTDNNNQIKRLTFERTETSTPRNQTFDISLYEVFRQFQMGGQNAGTLSLAIFHGNGIVTIWWCHHGYKSKGPRGAPIHSFSQSSPRISKAPVETDRNWAPAGKWQEITIGTLVGLNMNIEWYQCVEV